MYNILIVDDEKKEREGIALLLKRFGFPLRAALAQNGEDALKIMEKNHFDILLTDIKMPYMDGIQLIRETQKRGLNQYVLFTVHMVNLNMHRMPFH